ncbi:sulfatase-like hydrolase/transferase [Saccharicrinis aurantiacus]|uniref:sulfatase-like hydrolase/transferase n=1 Tax=Saccharicrinis aurantiacus TaxID=1849719 RepID=UPI0008390536|nr:sulfatase-like hydrolase/transferase [Saccharicrinis aurantiacus]
MNSIKLLLGILTLCFVGILKAEEPIPNILFILADDMGYSDVGFNAQMHPGRPIDIASPNLDKLANAGTKFTSAYAIHPFCGPSRAGLMTGRYPHALGSQFNLASYSKEGIDLNEKFISQVLQEAGYTTGIVGKWHLGEETPYQPNQRGFDEFYGFLGGGHEYFTNKWISVNQYNNKAKAEASWEYPDPLKHNNNWAPEPVNGEIEGSNYITDILTTKAVHFINDAKNNDSPFYLFVSYNAPHSLLDAKAEDMETLTRPKNNGGEYAFNYDANNNGTIDDGEEQDRLTLAGMVYALDRGVGKLVEALENNGQLDNTIIVFMSDNGGMSGYGNPKRVAWNNYPLRGHKGDIEEGGHRVPMFVKWPKSVSDFPDVYNHPVSGLDLYPTFASAAGVDINLITDNSNKAKVIDGIDIYSKVIQNEDARPDQPLFAMAITSPNNKIHVRKGKWKAKTYGNGTWFLYDIENDLHEDRNLAGANADVLNKIKDEAYAWTRTHTEPQFFHNQNTKNKWYSNAMPNWERTFPELATSNSSIWNDETLKFRVYPNPSNTDLNITFASVIAPIVNVSLYSMSGEAVMQKNIKRSNSNSLSASLSSAVISGNYIIAIESGTQRFVKQIAVKR